jgi:hypothetical protein
MSFTYKNPVSAEQVNDTLTILRDDTKGTTFSVNLVGGYMEVWSLDDLNFGIYGTGNIADERNKIPVRYYQRIAPFQSNQITINNDLISSGRRRLGMLVYVHETDTTYQYVIPNYQTLWDNAVSGNSVSSGDTTYTVSSGPSASPNTDGTALINAWLDSSIEGVSGVTRSNARWRIFYGTDITVTGGTFDDNTRTLTFTNTTGGTFNVTGITDTNIANTDLTLVDNRILSLDGNDLSIVGGSGESLSLSSTELVLSAATSGTITFKGILSSTELNYLVIDANGNLSYNNTPVGSEVAISALTYNDNWGLTKDYTDGSTNTTTLPFITGGTYVGGEITLNNALGGSISISAPESTDTYITGGTYNNTDGTLTLERNDAVTINITGFTTGTTEDTYVTGVTYSQETKTLTVGLNDGVDFNATGFAPTVSGGTYSNGEITLNNNDGTTSTISGLEILTHIGLATASTVSVSGTTIDTIDATTYKAAFFDYVIDDGTNYRAGTVQSVWDGTTIRINDISTIDIGTTTNFVWGMELSGGDALLKANISGGTWDIRIIKHLI